MPTGLAGIACGQHEQLGDLVLVHQGQRFGRQLAGMGDLGIRGHHLARPCGFQEIVAVHVPARGRRR